MIELSPTELTPVIYEQINKFIAFYPKIDVEFLVIFCKFIYMKGIIEGEKNILKIAGEKQYG